MRIFNICWDYRYAVLGNFRFLKKFARTLSSELKFAGSIRGAGRGKGIIESSDAEGIIGRSFSQPINQDGDRGGKASESRDRLRRQVRDIGSKMNLRTRSCYTYEARSSVLTIRKIILLCGNGFDYRTNTFS